MRTVGIIPARLQSTRLPRKLLLDETGRPLVQYTWEAACRAESLDEVIVATDSPEIAASVRAFGGRAEITGEHPSGTDRIAEIARRCCPQADILVNVQGDEPEIDPAQIDTLVALVANNAGCEMATLATPIPTITDRDDPACVKVVIAADGRALYFSRAPIPFVRDADDRISRLTPAARPSSPSQSPWLLHLGIYAYRREFLLQLTQLPPSRLEQLEKLEQLRALEAGALIRVGIVDHPAVGIDTPEDYARFVQRELDRAA
jgi:3-deoxy-manno-octulosonate cytidylyltransferase (CMP-KDO synthetase)